MASNLCCFWRGKSTLESISKVLLNNILSSLQLLAHEIGHNLGFYHDFDDHHGGQSSACNQNNHIMSYGSSKDKWSTCSKADFEARYLWVQQTSYVSWCMEGNIFDLK